MHKPYTGVLFDRFIDIGLSLLSATTCHFPAILVYLVEFIKLIQSIELTNENSFLVTMVVVSLYTKVPFEGGCRQQNSSLQIHPQYHLHCRSNSNCPHI